MHAKILQLSGKEYFPLYQTMSEEELERYAISFLIEESKALLFENGYSEKQMANEFKGDKIKLIHQALKFYGEKINSNQ